ncbi:DUF1489 domain-containing protein [Rhodoblastus acidophilus]|uniref:DUF1489 domain-containing protein n=1 Tax=Candidatus Rhodoblastus alkanivorans TaxID=2954117 RepID=A0ABS9Z656_9HYPH|nr:DUF1489 domain-containing protein [Candidatus Rhodoblastus alkanivorans]MCI4680284.1 DUF1489 domain-containing protein [Candidatus Rhodoblastus alkanivorans]MCI4683103.1 DUF1489 domain-containing protein [Candidatus Rhodoblastus alkanivorans]MDI4640414.1 DUF1489 domain-containing protein [Rhodoblastus acidophilus]
MPLHLLKLCVGADSVADLRAWTRMRRERQSGVHAHVTRMFPKRAEELLDGGSLYWVIKGQICARQKLIGIEPFVDSAGIKRCALQLDDEVVALRPRPHRAFQGWRYFEPAEAPPDLDATSSGLAEMPEALRRQLSELGLI